MAPARSRPAARPGRGGGWTRLPPWTDLGLKVPGGGGRRHRRGVDRQGGREVGRVPLDPPRAPPESRRVRRRRPRRRSQCERRAPATSAAHPCPPPPPFCPPGWLPIGHSASTRRPAAQGSHGRGGLGYVAAPGPRRAPAGLGRLVDCRAPAPPGTRPGRGRTTPFPAGGDAEVGGPRLAGLGVACALARRRLPWLRPRRDGHVALGEHRIDGERVAQLGAIAVGVLGDPGKLARADDEVLAGERSALGARQVQTPSTIHLSPARR